MTFLIYNQAGKHYFSVEEPVFLVFSWLFAKGRRLWALKGCGLLFDSKISPHSISKQKKMSYHQSDYSKEKSKKEKKKTH